MFLQNDYTYQRNAQGVFFAVYLITLSTDQKNTEYLTEWAIDWLIDWLIDELGRNLKETVVD